MVTPDKLVSPKQLQRSFTMKKSLIAIVSFLAFSSARAATADVYLDSDWYLQSGWVENKSLNANIVSFIYSMPTPTAGAAVFEAYLSTGTHSPYLAPGDFHYQAETWLGLNVNYGDRFYFSGLDIDYVEADGVTFNSGVIDTNGSTLGGAFVQVGFSDNTVLKYDLNATPWAVSQFFTQTPVQPVPEPASWMLFLGGGLLGMFYSKNKK